MHQPQSGSIESRESWRVATMALLAMLMAYGAPWITIVALRDIAGEAGSRSVPALASSLAWYGAGIGGIIMGRIADKIGTRWTVLNGALMIGIGLWLSSLGPNWPLWIGHGLFIGLLGLGGINAPLYVYVSRWFDRRRGSAMALISSGSYLAGTLWPTLFERAIAWVGWRQTMHWYLFLEIAVILPLALIYLRPPPEVMHSAATVSSGAHGGRVLGLRPNVMFAMLCAASVLCCIPMSIPQNHLVAFCGDLGISRTIGAAMLSLLLGTAFLSRQLWGLISDRIGGLRTVLIGSVAQTISMTGFLMTQSETGLFTVAGIFGLGFSGIIPAYVLAIREHFPASEASWRIPTLLLFSGMGMASGGWLAGLMYDHFGYYAPAFSAGIVSSILNGVILAALVLRMTTWRRSVAA